MFKNDFHMFNNKNIKKVLYLSIMLLVPFFAYSIKFKFEDKKGIQHSIQAIFDLGFSAKATADEQGITDYETIFFRPAFHFDNFGFGLDFDFRFKLFIGDVSFYADNWYISDETAYNRALNTFFIYIDKIDYIRYGSPDMPVYINFGSSHYITFASGFLVRDFHNNSFAPTQKEQGLFFKFNGNNLDRLEKIDKNIPIDTSFFITDLLDPDIFAFDFGINIIKFTPFKDKFDLRIGYTTIADINSTEANRISAMTDDEIVNHRNLSNSNYNLFTSFPWYNSLSFNFSWEHKIVKLNVYQETGLLLDFYTGGNGIRPGFGIKIGAEAKFINLKGSGHLLGVITGFMVESPQFTVQNFSSNYEVLRQKQYLSMINDTDYTFYITAGLAIYALQERIKFKLTMDIPLIMQYSTRFQAKFIMEDTIVKGLWFEVYYETGVNALYGYGNGTGLIDSMTRDFRFAFGGGYKFYGAKLSILIGIQRPAWVIPATNSAAGYPNDPYEELAAGNTVPNSYTTQNYDIDHQYRSYYWDGLDSTQYALDLQKFVSLEISFVF